jgi:hypothetical protein
LALFEKELNFSTNFINLLVKTVFGGDTWDHWEDPGVDVRIILRWIIRKWGGCLGFD